MSFFTVTIAFDDLFDGGTFAAGEADGGGLSLREALGLAGATGGFAQIGFGSGVRGETILLVNGALNIESDVVIIGNEVTLMGAGAERVMTVAANILNINLDSLTLRDGNAAGADGGAVSVGTNSTLSLFSVDLVANSAGRHGGALFLASGATAVLQDTRIGNNSAGNNGGGVAVAFGATLVATEQSAPFNDNAAVNSGGGIHLAGTAALDGVEIGGNIARWGGAIDVDGGDLQLTDATVHSNASIAGGGGINAFSGAFTINSTTVTGNSPSGHGGGIAVNAVGTIGNTIIAGNASSIGADVAGRARVHRSLRRTSSARRRSPPPTPSSPSIPRRRSVSAMRD
jgi:hypothetical protein